MNRSLAPLLILLGACASEPRKVTSPTGDIGVAVDATNAFTWDAFRQVTGDSDDDNVFVSPFSMHAALSMVLAGAEGTTEAEMLDVLHVSDESAHHAGLGALVRDLSEARQRPYTLHVASRIWGQDDVTWKEPFLDVNRDDYGAEVELTDISGDPEGTRADVNAWTADQTRDKIPELFALGDITSDTQMVLVNAIYFLADWKDGFDEENTSSESFTTLAGDVVQVPTMNRTAPSWHHDADGFAVLGMPYESDDLAMWLVLPDANTALPDLEAALDMPALDAAFDAAELLEDVALALPKLEARTRVDLVPTLSDMGMPTAFSPNADFSDMTDDMELTIGSAVHEAYVHVDEAGTEAAAATGVTMNRMSGEASPLPFVVDRPYLFAIRDELTGALLFVGRVTDPSAELASTE